jgi:D-alanyl-lipoteichoic acid acyltransferase DltB (MBOAT superfamily)
VFKKNSRSQNILLLLASLFFIGYCDVKSMLIIAGTGVVNYALLHRMGALEEGRNKTALYYFGIAWNIGVLACFKYLSDLWLGIEHLLNFHAIDLSFIALPLGLSFFTFQLIAYWIDVYNESVEPEKDVIQFSLYLFYFPKLVSGPIELAQRFMPQISTARAFNYALLADGLRQFLWGFFKKTVVSIHCLAFYKTFMPDAAAQGGNVLLGSFFYIAYIYSDFSGYSDMACGLSKLFGIRITNNFAFPFYSSNISEFWKKWHISLTTWVVTYVFTPLSFLLRKKKKWGITLAIVTSFLIVGLWHGARWNYMVFGLLHGLYFLPIVLKGGNLNTVSSANKLMRPLLMLGMFVLIAITSLFFREEPVVQSVQQIGSIFSSSLLHMNAEAFVGLTNKVHLLLIGFLFVFEYLNRTQEHGLQIEQRAWWMRWSMYFVVMAMVFFYSEFPSNGFVYVQF